MSGRTALDLHPGVAVEVNGNTVLPLQSMRQGIHVSNGGAGAVWRFGNLIGDRWRIERAEDGSGALAVLVPVEPPPAPDLPSIHFDGVGRLLHPGDDVAYYNNGELLTGTFTGLDLDLAVIDVGFSDGSTFRALVPFSLTVRLSDDEPADTNLHATLVEILHGAKLIESGARGMIDANTAHYLARMIVDGLGPEQLSGISG